MGVVCGGVWRMRGGGGGSMIAGAGVGHGVP